MMCRIRADVCRTQRRFVEKDWPDGPRHGEAGGMRHLRRALALLAALLAAAAAHAEPPAIHVRQVGAGTACWVLLHPFGASGRFWERRAPLLAGEHHVRIYAPDLPSHGLSRIVPHFSYDAATAEVARALRRDCPRPSLVIGASSGGIVAMKLAARTGARVATIGVGWSFSAANLASMAADAAHPSADLTGWLSTFAEQGAPQIAALEHGSADLAASGTTPFLSAREARALGGRLLVLHGDADDFFLTDSAEALVAHVRGALLARFPGAGHLEPLASANAPRAWRLIEAFAATGAIPPE